MNEFVDTLRTTGTVDPAPFDWFVFVAIPSFVGLATIGVAVVAVVIAVQANNRANDAAQRQMRTDFAQAFMNYTRSPSLGSAMAVKWPEAHLNDPAVAKIPVWYQEQKLDTRLTAGALEMSIETRLIEWIKTGRFRDGALLNAEGSLLSI